jgi:hypothetical protein
VIDVHQVVHDPRGHLLVDQVVRHAYQLRNGLIARMDILEPHTPEPDTPQPDTPKAEAASSR